MKSNKAILSLSFLLIIMIFGVASAGTYYVDATKGDDGNSGTSESASWKTLAKVSNSRFQPGDVILLKRGEIWYESLDLHGSGKPGSPIIIGAYEQGPRPILDGTDIEPNSGFRKTPGYQNVYHLTEIRMVGHVLEDGKPLGAKMLASVMEVDATPGSWFLDQNKLYVHASGGSDITTNGKVYRTRVQMDGIVVGNVDDREGANNYVTIESMHLKNFIRWAINGVNSDHMTVRNCVIEDMGAIKRQDPVGVGLNHSTTNALVENNLIHDIGHNKVGAGVYIGTAGSRHNYRSTNNVVRNNEIYNCHVGVTIKVYSDDNRIESNFIHDITSQGVRAVGQFDKGNLITRNLIMHCEEEGIETFNSSTIAHNIVLSCYAGIIVITKTTSFEDNLDAGKNNKILNNTLFDCIVGISLHNPESGDYPENNIVENNIISECFRAIRFENGKLPKGLDNLFDYNCYFRSDNLTFADYDVSLTFQEWRDAYGGDAHSITANPLFVVPNPQTGRDFMLRPGSPCIDSGNNVGLSQDFNGRPIPQGKGPEIGAHEFNGGKAIAPPRNVRIETISTN